MNTVKTMCCLMMVAGCKTENPKVAIVDEIRTTQKVVDSLDRVLSSPRALDTNKVTDFNSDFKTAALYRLGKKKLDSLKLELQKY